MNRCINCHKIIDKRAKRCSDCYHKYQLGIHNGNYRHGKYIKNKCECGQQIDPRAIRCRSCASQYKWEVSIGLKNRNQLGNLNPNWIDGRSYEPYPQEWTESFKKLIHKRDNYTCQNCDMTEEEHLIVYGQVLHIHHIDYNKKNCKEDNLVTTCNSCNTRANYNRSYWNKFYTKIIKCLQK